MNFVRSILLAALLVPALLAYDVYRDDGGYVNVWYPGTIAMRIKMPASPALSDGTNFASSVQAAMQTWNTKLGVIQFSSQVIDTAMNPPSGTYTNGNQINEIAIDSQYGTGANRKDFGSNTLAVTVTYPSGNTLVESDMVFNSAFNWDSYRGNLRLQQDIRRVAIHELGHTLGLNHPDEASPVQSVAAIMNSHVSNLDTMQADDIAGAQLMYAAPGFVPANDNFASAITIDPTSFSAVLTGSNVAATKQSGEPNHAGASANGHSVWWKWTAPGSGSTTITTLGSNFDTVLAVYTGSAVNTLTEVAANDDAELPTPGNPDPLRKRTSTVTFSAISGTTYSIAVDGWGKLSDGDLFTYTGAITLNLDFSGTISAAAPVFTTQPASKAVAAGIPVTFTAVASGNPTPTYQWQKDSVAILGATNDSYSIASPVAADAGNYTVVATNSNGSTTSKIAVLAITFSAPVFIIQPLSQTVSAGTPVTFTAQATGTPTPSYQWQKNGITLPDTNNASYTIANPSVADAGNYSVVATSAAGLTISDVATLVVIVAPTGAIIMFSVE